MSSPPVTSFHNLKIFIEKDQPFAPSDDFTNRVTNLIAEYCNAHSLIPTEIDSNPVSTFKFTKSYDDKLNNVKYTLCRTTNGETIIHQEQEYLAALFDKVQNLVNAHWETLNQSNNEQNGHGIPTDISQQNKIETSKQEIAQLKENLNGATKNISKLEEEKKDLARQIEALQQSISIEELNTRLGKIKDEGQDDEGQDNNLLNTVLTTYPEELNKMSTSALEENETLKNEIKSIKKNEEELNKQLREKDESIKNTSSEMSSLKQQITELKKNSDEEIEKSNKENSTIKNELDDTKKKLTELQNQLTASQENEKVLNEKKEAFNEQIKELTQRLEGLQPNVRVMENEIQDKTTDLGKTEMQKTIESLTKKQTEYASEIEKLNCTIQSLKDQTSRVNEENEQLRTELATRQQENGDLKNENGKIRKIIASGEINFDLQEEIDISEDLEETSKNTSSLPGIKFEQADVKLKGARAALQKVQEKNEEFYKKLESQNQEISNLKARIAELNENKQDEVSKDAAKIENQKLQEEVKKTKKERDELKKRNNQLTGSVSENENEINNLSTTIAKITSENQKLQQELKQLKKNSTSIRDDYNAEIEEIRNNHRQAISTINAKMRRLNKENEDHKGSMAYTNDLLEGKDMTTDYLRTEIKELKNTVKAKVEEIQALNAQLEKANDNNITLERTLHDNNNKITNNLDQ